MGPATPANAHNFLPENRLLLHSLAEFREIILDSLSILGCRSIVEVGTGEGALTHELATWAKRNNAVLHCVDTDPCDVVERLRDQHPDNMRLHKGKSLEVLSAIGTCDSYLLDGDHNYYTVSSELRIIRRICSEAERVLIFLHDTGGLCGRRDCYFSPADLPAEAVHPYHVATEVSTYCSVDFDAPARRHLTGALAIANHAGGPKNGVLTAIEDFLAETPGMAFVNVPCVFGLGIIYRCGGPLSESLSDYLLPYHNNPLLRRLEANRLDLYLNYAKLKLERHCANDKPNLGV